MIEEIENIVCIGEKLPPEYLHAPDRETTVKEARQIIMYLAKTETRLTHALIGGYFGQDHATSSNSCKRINDLIDTDPLFRAKVRGYTDQVRDIYNQVTKIETVSATLNSLLTGIEIMEARLLSMRESFENLKSEINKLK